jgi:CheY-like chemotaxis protein
VGTTFHFSIEADAAALPEPLFLQSRQPSLTGKRMLIVHDNPTSRRILVGNAESWGMHASPASSAAEALSWIARGDRYDVGVLDAGTDPAALAAALSSHLGAAPMPLLLLAPLGHSAEAGARFAAVLTKPVKPSQLYDALVAVFDTSVVRKPAARSPALVDEHLAERLPRRILLAEDNATNQRVASFMLNRMGYRVDVVGNGLEALEALRRQTYDVVFMDLQMPELDGLEATRRIVSQPSASRPWIVAMTANAMPGDRERCLAAGMDDYIAKPVEVGELAAAIVHSVAGAAARAPGDAGSAPG